MARVLRPLWIVLLLCLTVAPAARGTDQFIRSDANLDGTIDIADAVSGLAVLFAGAPSTCHDALDANDDGLTDIDASDPDVSSPWML